MRKYIATMALATVVALPIVARADDDDHHRERTVVVQRYYDRDHRDYHEWNEGENRAYRHYLQEQNREYRDWNRVGKREQRNYWRWRHDHQDYDRDDRR